MKDFFSIRCRTVHNDCHALCYQSFGRYFPVSGNLGIFCQSDTEYEEYTLLRERLTYPSDNPNQKYFRLIEPIQLDIRNGIPAAVYSHLYIRKPDPTPYGTYLGDVDFVLNDDEYNQLKKEIVTNPIEGVVMYDRPGWDTIQITDPDISSVAYISTMEMAVKARVKFD